MAVRVFQIAKEYAKEPEEIIKVLRKSGIKVSSHTSPLDEHALHTVRAHFGNFKLTIVDTEASEPEPAGEEGAKEEPSAPPKKKTKKKAPVKPAAPRLAVRVIKKHEDEKPPETEDEAEEVEAKEEAPKPKPKPRLKLRKPASRKTKIEERIQALTHKSDAPAQSPAAKPDEGKPAAADARRERVHRRPEKRSERPLALGQHQERKPTGKVEVNLPPNPNRNQDRNRGAGNRRRGDAPRPNNVISNPADLEVARERQTQQGRGTGPGRPRYGGHGGPKPKKKKRRRRQEEHLEKVRPIAASRVELPQEELGIIMLSEGVTVKELAEKVNRKSKDIIKRLFEKGILATLNDVLESDLAIEIAKDFGYLAEIVSFEEDLQIKEDEGINEGEETKGEMKPRSPIVTIMGHVDHGKTTLLDAIRSTKVASGEAGGITQHIGAYSVPWKEQDIVFLDTPGHEAFTKMRARGASVTDIVILVVAADDGVKPQTIEAISHAKAAKVPIITCINKIDKPDANPERVKQMLTEHDLIVEDFGGDSPSVEVSAKQKMGIEDLLEMILLVSELQEFKANPARLARGTVIEAKLDRGRGPVATLIVQEGTLQVGEIFISGQTYGKIRAMHDDMGSNINEAGPATPIEVLGLNEVPAAGDTFQVVKDETEARRISSYRKDQAREDTLRRQKHTSLDQLFRNLDEDEVKELPVILKADVQGSVEGLVFALNKIESEKVNLRIVLQGVGNITENDVLLAAASDAIIIGFNVKTEPKAMSTADQEGIEVRSYSVIYEVVKDIESAMLGLVAPTYEEQVLGKAIVKQVFSVSRLGKVAGCQVDSGIVKRDAQVRLFRGEELLHTGVLQTLKRFKDDVNEVKAGYECGIGIRDFDNIEEGDTMEFFTMAEVQATEL